MKLDRLDWVIRHYGLHVAPDALKHAQRSIKGYDLSAIRQTEEAFLKAIRRNASRLNLAYFFGILKNIQRKMDEDAKREYCRKRYNHDLMLNMERQKQEQPKPQFSFTAVTWKPMHNTEQHLKIALKSASRAFTNQDVKEHFPEKSAIQTVFFVARPVETVNLPLSTEL